MCPFHLICILLYCYSYIKKYVCCKKCGLPELKHQVDGKDLKSVCNSCGNTALHDAAHKAGKEFIKYLK